MNQPNEPQIYQQLRQLTEDAAHFNEALKLLTEKHNLYILSV